MRKLTPLRERLSEKWFFVTSRIICKVNVEALIKQNQITEANKISVEGIMNLPKLIFSSIDLFKVVSVNNLVEFVNIYVQSWQKICRCPDCQSPSKKFNSYYLR